MSRSMWTRRARAGLAPPSGSGEGLMVAVGHDLDTLVPEWDELAERCDASLFMCSAWMRSWWGAFGAGELNVLTTRRDGRLTGLFPMMRVGHVLRSTTNGHTPEFDPLADDGESLAALADASFDDPARHVRVSFLQRGVADLLRSAARAGGRHVTIDTIEESPYLPIEGDWHSYEQRVDGKILRDLRRRRRKLEEEGALTLEIADGRTRLDDLLAEGFRLEASGWKGEAGTAIESDPATRRFYADVAGWAAPRGSLRLAFLRLDGKPLAFQYGLVDRSAYYFLKGGYDTDYRRFAPGRLLVQDMLRYAFDVGLSRFEFLGTAESWKLEWTDERHDRQRIDAFARSLVGMAAWAADAYGRPFARRMRPLVAALRR